MRTLEDIEEEYALWKQGIPFADSDVTAKRLEELETELQLALVEEIDIDRLREIVEAEKDGRLVVLPCKVGDTVWLTVRGCLEPQKVRTFFVGHPSCADVPFDPRYYMVRLEKYDIPLRDFGKTVFLTYEEATAALEKKEGKENDG